MLHSMIDARWTLAVRSDGRLFSASTVEPGLLRAMCSAGELVCPIPACGDPRLEYVRNHLRNGRHVAPHFRHRRAPDTDTHSGESVQHLLAKLHLDYWARSSGFDVIVEGFEPSLRRRPDVTVIEPISARRLYVEVQYAGISIEAWTARNGDLQHPGGNVLWLWGTHGAHGDRALTSAQQTCLQAHGQIWFVQADPEGLRLGAGHQEIRDAGRQWLDWAPRNATRTRIRFHSTDRLELSERGIRQPEYEHDVARSRDEARRAVARCIAGLAHRAEQVERARALELDRLRQLESAARRLTGDIGTSFKHWIDWARPSWECLLGPVAIRIPLDQSSMRGHRWIAHVGSAEEAASELVELILDGAGNLQIVGPLLEPAHTGAAAPVTRRVATFPLSDVVSRRLLWRDGATTWSPFGGTATSSGWIPARASTAGHDATLDCSECQGLVTQTGQNDRWLPANAATWKRIMLLRANLLDREECVEFVSTYFGLDLFDTGRAVRPFHRGALPHANRCGTLQRQRAEF